MNRDQKLNLSRDKRRKQSLAMLPGFRLAFGTVLVPGLKGDTSVW